MSTTKTPAAPLTDMDVRHATAQAEERACADMGNAVEQRILAPVSLLACLLTSLDERAVSGDFSLDTHELCSTLGNLLLLMARGARQELEIQKMGGDGAYALTRFLEKADSELRHQGAGA